jgi:hypothetical protein
VQAFDFLLRGAELLSERFEGLLAFLDLLLEFGDRFIVARGARSRFGRGELFLKRRFSGSK